VRFQFAVVAFALLFAHESVAAAAAGPSIEHLPLTKYGCGLSALAATAYLLFRGDSPAVVAESDAHNPQLSSLVCGFYFHAGTSRTRSVEAFHE
jgi:hypothetical protein